MNRQDLFEYKKNKKWIESRKEKIEKEYESIQKMITNYKENTKMASEKQDSMAENLAILLDMKLEVLSFSIKLEEDLNKIDKALLKIKQPYRNILTDVYVKGTTLVMVANHMRYNYKDICIQHGRALKMYDDL